MNRVIIASILSEALESLARAEIPAATAEDATRIETIVKARKIAVMLNPPRIAYTTSWEADVHWDLWLVTTSGRLQTEAWDRLSAAIEALRLPLEISEASPEAFSPDSGEVYPAYSLKFTNTYTL